MRKKAVMAFFLILLVARPFISSAAFPLQDVVFTVILMTTGLFLLERKTYTLKHLPAPFLVILFLLSVVISVCFSKNIINSLSQLYKYSAYTIIFFTVAYFKKEQKRLVVTALLSASLLVGLYAILWFLKGSTATVDYLYSHQIKWPFAFEYLSRGRAFVPFICPSALAGYLILFTPLGYALLYVTRNGNAPLSPEMPLKNMPFKNTLLFLIVFSLSTALLSTQSLGALVSLMAAFCIFIFLRKKKINEKLFFVAIFLFLGCLLFFLIFRCSNRYYFNLPVFSITNRLSYWRQALINISRHPFVGYGPGNYPFFKGLSPHNSYLQIAAETGIFGLITFLAIAFQTIKARCTDIKPSQAIIFDSLWIGGLAFLIHNLIEFTFFLPEVSLQWWIFAALLVGQRRPD